MSKLYNTNSDIANFFASFFSSSCPFLPKTALNIFPHVISSMLISSSCITKNIALSCKGSNFDFIQSDSVSRRIRRFFNNKNYDPYRIYQSIISHSISKFSCKHSDNRVHIVFDHMFKSEVFSVFMFSLRIGKKSIPLWFKCFEGGHHSSQAFNENTIKEGILFVSNLFKGSNYNLIFLADRWFSFPYILDFINSLGHTYVIRTKSKLNVKYLDPNEGHVITKKIEDLFHYTHKATYYENIKFTSKELLSNIVFSPSKSVTISKKSNSSSISEPWILLTNGDVKRAIKDYSYRFGAIEFLFKDQKSNCFNLQKSSTRNLQAFSMMYTCVCICILYLTCLGT